MNFKKAAQNLAAQPAAEREAENAAMWAATDFSDWRDDAVSGARSLRIARYGKSCPALDAEAARRGI